MVDRRLEAEANTLLGVLKRWNNIPSLAGTPMPVDYPLEIEPATYLDKRGDVRLSIDQIGRTMIELPKGA